jgi:hypothetical protein
MASLRVKLSIVDTIADRARSDVERSNAALITTFFRLEILSHTTSTPRDELHGKNIWPTITPVYKNCPDIIENMLKRTCSALKQTPYLAKLFHSMFLETLPKSHFADYAVHCERWKRVDGRPKKSKFLAKLLQIIRPDYLAELPPRRRSGRTGRVE